MHDLDHFRRDYNDKYQVWHISGGRTSGMMLRLLLDAHGGIPANAEAIFTNTGKENTETLDFLAEMSDRWSAPITWLEYRMGEARNSGGSPSFAVVERSTASTTGRPFDEMILREGAIPNMFSRFCTRELKKRTVYRYLASKGIMPRHRVELLGIRYDEKRRIDAALMEECKADYPLVHAAITRQDVADFWSRQTFALGIPDYAGNCDMCFLKGKSKLFRILRENPAKADWWIAHEERVKDRVDSEGRPPTFNPARKGSVRALRDAALSVRTLFDDADDDESVSCFCGD